MYKMFDTEGLGVDHKYDRTSQTGRQTDGRTNGQNYDSNGVRVTTRVKI